MPTRGHRRDPTAEAFALPASAAAAIAELEDANEWVREAAAETLGEREPVARAEHVAANPAACFATAAFARASATAAASAASATAAASAAACASDIARQTSASEAAPRGETKRRHTAAANQENLENLNRDANHGPPLEAEAAELLQLQGRQAHTPRRAAAAGAWPLAVARTPASYHSSRGAPLSGGSPAWPGAAMAHAASPYAASPYAGPPPPHPAARSSPAPPAACSLQPAAAHADAGIRDSLARLRALMAAAPQGANKAAATAAAGAAGAAGDSLVRLRALLAAPPQGTDAAAYGCSGMPSGGSREPPGAEVLQQGAATLSPPGVATSCLGVGEALGPEASLALFQPLVGGGALKLPATGAGWADRAGGAPMPP